MFTSGKITWVGCPQQRRSFLCSPLEDLDHIFGNICRARIVCAAEEVEAGTVFLGGSSVIVLSRCPISPRM